MGIKSGSIVAANVPRGELIVALKRGPEVTVDGKLAISECRVIVGEMPHSERRRTFGISGMSVIKHTIADFICLRLLIWVSLPSKSVFPVLLLKILMFFEVSLAYLA